MSASVPAVEASALAKRFAGRAAVNGVDFTLGAGDCLALFGPNGAGKTTLLRLLAGLLKPSGGSVRLAGTELRRDAGARARVGLLSHQNMLYAPLSARENVEFFARLYGIADARGRAEVALRAMGVLDRAEVAVRTLSRGLQQRVSIARAIVHDPQVLLLDEPYSGLDEGGAAALTGLLRDLRDRGATLLLVTHNVPEGLALATHAAIMTSGRFARFESAVGAGGGGGFDPHGYARQYRELVTREG
jgi:heme exporter protein A